jgi:hypothetical protein
VLRNNSIRIALDGTPPHCDNRQEDVHASEGRVMMTQLLTLLRTLLSIGNIHATVGCAPPDEMPPTRARFPV